MILRLCFAVFLVPAWAAAKPRSEPQTTFMDLWPGTPPGPAALVEGAERDLTKAEDKLAWDLEGTEVAEWLNSIGFAAVVVKYRVPTREHGDALNETGTAPLKVVGPVMDAQRAISLTRAHAAEWGIDPDRIGIMGFSAGGETAGLTALLGGQRLYPSLSANEPSCAPDFTLLIYPGGFYDKESGGLKSHLKVTKDTPPMFFVMAQDDHVNPLNCTVLYTALTKEKVPAELHLFPRGGHGYGLRPTSDPVTLWPKAAEVWLKGLAAPDPAFSQPKPVRP